MTHTEKGDSSGSLKGKAQRGGDHRHVPILPWRAAFGSFSPVNAAAEQRSRTAVALDQWYQRGKEPRSLFCSYRLLTSSCAMS